MTHAFIRKANPWIGVIILSIILFASSCVYDKEFSYINDQIVALNNRVADLQETMDQRIDSQFDSKLNTDIDPKIDRISTNQAEVMAEVDRLKTEISKLEGRIEDNEHIIKQAVERDLTKQDTIRSELDKLSEIRSRIEKLEIMVNQQNEYLGLEPVRRSGGAEKSMETGRVSRAERDVSPAEQNISPEEAAYNGSLALFREEKYVQAIDGFTRFLDLYPKSELADNAQFWIGESYMALKQYEKAILAYQDVIEKYPKANKVPNAMQRQAMAWLEIDDKTSARAVFKKLIKEFPDSSEAKIAEKKLNQLE